MKHWAVVVCRHNFCNQLDEQAFDAAMSSKPKPVLTSKILALIYDAVLYVWNIVSVCRYWQSQIFSVLTRLTDGQYEIVYPSRCQNNSVTIDSQPDNFEPPQVGVWTCIFSRAKTLRVCIKNKIIFALDTVTSCKDVLQFRLCISAGLLNERSLGDESSQDCQRPCTECREIKCYKNIINKLKSFTVDKDEAVVA